MVSAVIVMVISAVVCTVCRVPKVSQLRHGGWLFSIQLFDEIRIYRPAVALECCPDRFSKPQQSEVRGWP